MLKPLHSDALNLSLGRLGLGYRDYSTGQKDERSPAEIKLPKHVCDEWLCRDQCSCHYYEAFSDEVQVALLKKIIVLSAIERSQK